MYMFGLLSETIKDVFHLDQSSLDIVGSSGTVGSQVGIHVGFIYDAFGPKFTLGLGGLLSSGGFLLLWLAMHFAWKVTTAPLAAITFMYGQGQMTIDVAVIPTLAANFPNHRGTAVGMGKAFVGLSGSLAAAFYNGFVYPDIVSFILLLVVWIIAACVIGVLFVERCAGVQGLASPLANDVVRRQFMIGFAIVYAMCALLLAIALWEHLVDLSNGLRSVLAMCVFAANAVLVSFLGTRREQSAQAEPGSSWEQTGRPPSVECAQAEMRQYTLTEAACTVEFWLLFLGSIAAAGGGLLLINNIAQVNLALGENDKVSNTFVSLLSISNCLGRMIAGTLSDWLVLRFPGFPRPAYLAGSQAVCALLMAAFALFPSSTSLYFLVAVVGAGYGSINAINPVLAAEVFGVAHLGSIYTAFSLAFAFSSYGFATFLFGGVYDAESHGACVIDDVCRPGSYSACLSGTQTSCCLGPACMSLSFGVSAAAALLSVCLYLLVAYRTRDRYIASTALTTPCISLLSCDTR